MFWMRLVSEKILGLLVNVPLKLWLWKEGEKMTFGECDLSLVCVWPAHWFDYWSSSHFLSPVLHLFEVLTGSQAGELIIVCLKTWGVLGEAGNGVGRAWDQERCRGPGEVWARSPRVSSAGPGSEQDSNTWWMTKWMKMEIFTKQQDCQLFCNWVQACPAHLMTGQ